MINTTIIEAQNATRYTDLKNDYDALGEKLSRGGIDIDALKDRAKGFSVAVPSWGTGTGGTRFARFPGEGEPRDIFDKLDDCDVIHIQTPYIRQSRHVRTTVTLAHRSIGQDGPKPNLCLVTEAPKAAGAGRQIPFSPQINLPRRIFHLWNAARGEEEPDCQGPDPPDEHNHHDDEASDTI